MKCFDVAVIIIWGALSQHSVLLCYYLHVCQLIGAMYLCILLLFMSLLLLMLLLLMTGSFAYELLSWSITYNLRKFLLDVRQLMVSLQCSCNEYSSIQAQGVLLQTEAQYTFFIHQYCISLIVFSTLSFIFTTYLKLFINPEFLRA